MLVFGDNWAAIGQISDRVMKKYRYLCLLVRKLGGNPGADGFVAQRKSVFLTRIPIREKEFTYHNYFACQFMESVTFKIREGETFIPLIQLLKAAHVVYSGGEAQQLVMDGEVLRNGAQELRKRAKIVAGDIVEANGFRITVE